MRKDSEERFENVYPRVWISEEEYTLKALCGDVVHERRVQGKRWVNHWPGMIAQYANGAMFMWTGDPHWSCLHIGARPGPEKMHARERANQRPNKGGA